MEADAACPRCLIRGEEDRASTRFGIHRGRGESYGPCLLPFDFPFIDDGWDDTGLRALRAW